MTGPEELTPCRRCGIPKPAHDYYVGRGRTCRPCLVQMGRERDRRLRAENPGEWSRRQRRYRLRSRYGVDPDWYDCTVEAQGSLCAVCREKATLLVHRDPETKCIRGLVCGQCKRAFRCFKEDLEVLLSAVDYFQRILDPGGKKASTYFMGAFDVPDD